MALDTAGRPTLESFRQAFRSWLRDAMPDEWRQTVFPRNWPPGDEDEAGVARSTEWQRLLRQGGWLAPGWPVEHGGLGLGLEERMVMVEELALARAPAPIGFQGLDILGPALIAFGSEEQKRCHLPRILSGEDLWCQGYSEPNAGSDLAAMTTRAVVDGDDYVVTGQKVWTSYGRRAKWCFLLARTGPPESRHRGISFLLTPMDVPGIDWRPIRQVTGEAEFGELFLDEVRIPRSNVVGQEGEGWRVAVHSLAHERMLAGNVAPMRARVDALVDLARARPISPDQRRRVAQLEIRVTTAMGLQRRALELAQRDDPRFPAWASMVKLESTELRLAIAEVALDMLGMDGVASSAAATESPSTASGPATAWPYEFLDSRAGTLYAGTSEIQRNIIAEVGLGLPR